MILINGRDSNDSHDCHDLAAVCTPSNCNVGLEDEMRVDSKQAGTWCSRRHACGVKQPLQLYPGCRLFRKGVLSLLYSWARQEAGL